MAAPTFVLSLPSRFYPSLVFTGSEGLVDPVHIAFSILHYCVVANNKKAPILFRLPSVNFIQLLAVVD